jgi:hypothetical protein
MAKVLEVLKKAIKPALIIGGTGAAAYFGGAPAGQAALEILTQIFGG